MLRMALRFFCVQTVRRHVNIKIKGSAGIKIPFLNDNCFERKLLLRRHQMACSFHV